MKKHMFNKIVILTLSLILLNSVTVLAIDTECPVLMSVSLSSSSVAVGDTLTISIDASDPDSGIDAIWMSIESPKYGQTIYFGVPDSSTTRSAQIEYPGGIELGTWAVNISMMDNAGNVCWSYPTNTYVEIYDPNNLPPVADAGTDQTVDEGVTVTLDGSNSTDADYGIASYQWIQTAGTSVTLSDPTAIQPTFTAPDVGPSGESLTFQLTVTDNGGLTDTDTCIVNVTWVNVPPTADAGSNQTVGECATVTLDGSHSSDPDDGVASYLWTQTEGTSVTLSDPTSAMPTFTAPSVGVGGEALIFQLTVTDNNGLSETDTVIINVSNVNQAPTANAGPDQTVDEGDTVTLDGSDSFDTNDGIASYQWTQTAGPAVTLSDVTALQPTFVAPSVDSSGTTLTFQLTVEDRGGLQDTDEVSLTIKDTGVTGYLVTTNLWIRAVINTEEKGPIEAVWKKGGEDTTSAGDRVIWGHFYASPSDVTWGSENNPDLFVKIWFDISGRVDVNFFHVSVPDIEVYSALPDDGSPDEQGTTTMDRRYIRQYYENGQSYSDENYEDGNPPSGYSPTGNPSGYSTINDLRIGSIINTVEKGLIDAVWRLGGQDTTSRGDQVVWGHFYASPSDVTWGSENNPDLFVKIWFNVSGRVDVNFFHVSVPDIEGYSDLPYEGTYDQQGTTIMDNRYIRHEYWR